jgi:hypothetical protein
MDDVQVLHAFGKTHTIAQWAKVYGVKPNVIRQRVNRYGWPVEKAITVPAKKHWGKRKIYTVYLRADDSLVCMGSSQECADFLGIQKDSFVQMVSRSRHQADSRYEIFADDWEPEDDPDWT